MDWSELAQTTRSRLLQCIRDAINERQQRGEVVLRYAALYRTGKADMRIRATRVRSRRSQHCGRAVAVQCVPLVFAETRRHVLALHAAEEIDEYHRARAHINQSDLAAGLHLLYLSAYLSR
jgi:hypothetical protein